MGGQGLGKKGGGEFADPVLTVQRFCVSPRHIVHSVLADGKINIEMISQGASEINVSCVIARTDSLKALRLVHGLLELEKLK